MTQTLEPLDFPETFHEAILDRTSGTHPADPLVVALNRVAAALETYNRGQGHLGQVEAPAAQFAPLPGPAARPACPLHGIDKVAPSRNGAGFYCQAKAQPGQPSNAKGYCTWQS